MPLLLVEDDRELAHGLSCSLAQSDYAADVVFDGQSAILACKNTDYDLVILDLGLPDMDGLEVLRRLRKTGMSAPVLILTARFDLDDRVSGLDAGGDDYLAKPFALPELEARIRALYRRGRLQKGDVLRVADLELDPVHLTVTRAGQPLSVTRAGFQLLEALMRQAPHLVRHAELAHALWGEAGGDIATLHTHLSVLRSIIDRPFSNRLLHTVHGFGYRIAESTEA